MKITITELQLVRLENGYVNIYLVATASQGQWTLTEEFHIGRQWVGQGIVTDARGWWKRIDGVFIDPATLDPDQPEPQWEREPVLADLEAEIKDVVIKTMKGKLSRGPKQDRPQALKQVMQRALPVWDDTTKLPLRVRQMIDRTETV